MGKTKKAKSFVMVDRLMLKSEAWKQLSNRERVLYVHLNAHYTGANNGDIIISYNSVKGMKGMKGQTTISAALRGLEEKEWIEKTGPGGLCGCPSTYRLTGKYDPAMW